MNTPTRLFSIVISIILCTSLAFSQNNWIPTDGPCGGVCTEIASTANGTLYAACGGVYRSTNHGVSWQPTGYYGYVSQLFVSDSAAFVMNLGDLIRIDCQPPQFMQRFGAYSGALSIDQQGRLFESTGEINNYLYRRSTDYGATWINLDSTMWCNPDTPIGVFPDGSLMVNALIPYNAHSGIPAAFRSFDHGNTWNIIGDVSTENAYGIEHYALSTNGIGFCSLNYGVGQTTDYGATWHSFIPQMFYLKKIGLEGDSVLCELVKPTSDSSIFYTKPVTGGTLTRTVLPHNISTFESKDSLGIIYGGDFPGIWRADAGGNYTPSVDSLNALTTRNIFFDEDNRIHYFGNDGLKTYHFYSDDNGDSWTSTNFPANVYYPQIVMEEQHLMYTITSNNEFYHSTDHGTSWGQFAHAPGVSPGLFDILSDGTIFVVDDDVWHSWTYLYASTNYGSTWHRIAVSDSETFGFIQTISAADTVLIIGTTTGTYSCVANDTLRRISNAVCKSLATKGYDGLYYWWVGDSTFWNCLYVTTPNWSTQTRISLPDSVDISAPVAVDAVGNIYLQNYAHTLLSNDRGAHWNEIATGLPVFNGGDYLPSNTVIQFALNPYTEELFAGMTHGLFHTQSPVTGVATPLRTSLPSKVTLLSNYPNPFNSTTRISFTIPKSERVSLTVYDVLGRKVATLMNNEQLTAGTHEKIWNANKLATGIYFYRLQTGSSVFTKKMMYLK